MSAAQQKGLPFLAGPAPMFDDKPERHAALVETAVFERAELVEPGSRLNRRADHPPIGDQPIGLAYHREPCPFRDGRIAAAASSPGQGMSSGGSEFIAGITRPSHRLRSIERNTGPWTNASSSSFPTRAPKVSIPGERGGLALFAGAEDGQQIAPDRFSR
jgi:hypothetical protein